MKKYFTLNMGLEEIDYVASNESIPDVKPILVVDANLSANEVGEDRLLHLSVLLAVPKEVLDAAKNTHPVIYIYNGKDFKDGFIDEV